MKIYIADISKCSDLKSNSKKNKLLSQLGKQIVIEEIKNSLLLNEKDINIVKNINGKPYLENYSGFHFNISHSGNICAVAFCDRPIGIDIEEIRNVKTSHAEKLFNEKECEYIFSNEQDTSYRFLEMWTKKEALVKLNGQKLFSAIKNKHSFKENVTTINYKNIIISFCSQTTINSYEIIEIKNVKKYLT